MLWDSPTKTSVRLVEIDVVGLKASERGVDGVEDVLAGEAPVPRAGAGGARALGGHDELVAAAGQPAAQDLLGASDRLRGAAERIDVGGVEEGDAALGRVVENGARRRLVALQPEGHRAQAQARDRQPGAAEPDVAHPLSGP
jgi:hypothetical protein